MLKVAPRVVPKWSQSGPKAKVVPKPKWSQSGPKVVPKWSHSTWSQSGPKVVPNWSQGGPKVVPKWSQSGPNGGPKRGSKGGLGPSRTRVFSKRWPNPGGNPTRLPDRKDMLVAHYRCGAIALWRRGACSALLGVARRCSALRCAWRCSALRCAWRCSAKRCSAVLG